MEASQLEIEEQLLKKNSPKEDSIRGEDIRKIRSLCEYEVTHRKMNNWSIFRMLLLHVLNIGMVWMLDMLEDHCH